MQLTSGGHLTFFMPGRQKSIEMELTEPVLLSDLLARLNIPLSEVQLVALNGEMQADLAVWVRNADRVAIFSSVDGG